MSFPLLCRLFYSSACPSFLILSSFDCCTGTVQSLLYTKSAYFPLQPRFERYVFEMASGIEQLQSPLSSVPVDEKSNVIHIEDANNMDTSKMSRTEKIEAIDAIAADTDVTLESFAHLDINKILRKIDMRLIPMLTALVTTSYSRSMRHR